MSVNYEKVTEYFVAYVGKVKHLLNEDGIKEAEHFLGHDEYEMAFEILLLEIMQANAILPELVEAKSIAIDLKLHEESVFDDDFWSKFSNFYGNLYSNQ